MRSPFAAVGDQVWFADAVLRGEVLTTLWGTWHFGAKGCDAPAPADATPVTCERKGDVPWVDGVALVRRGEVWALPSVPPRFVAAQP